MNKARRKELRKKLKKGESADSKIESDKRGTVQQKRSERRKSPFLRSHNTCLRDMETPYRYRRRLSRTSELAVLSLFCTDWALFSTKLSYAPALEPSETSCDSKCYHCYKVTSRILVTLESNVTKTQLLKGQKCHN
jgi:hypothetical protein